MSTGIFERRAFEVFDTTEINEPLLLLYKQLSFAIRDHCDTLTLDRTSFQRNLHGTTVSTIPTIYGNDSIYIALKENLLKIFKRDPLIKKYFQLEFADDMLIIKTIAQHD
jgi:hypothetical protein